MKYLIICLTLISSIGLCDMIHAYPGFLCSIEGIDGSGKTTLIQNLAIKFTAHDFKYLITKELGATNLGKHVRQFLAERPTPITPLAEFLLFAADRAQHFNELIIPHLCQDYIIISDRMADSSLAYQGYLKGIDKNIISYINNLCMQSIKPDIVIYLKIDPENAIKRILQHRGFATAQEQEYLHKMKDLVDAFDAIFATRDNVIIIDALQDPEIVAQQVYDTLLNNIEKKRHEFYT